MSDRELTPEQDEAVRALLASGKHTEAMPVEVTARLDDVLAELVAERHEHRAPVVTLASRRRRVVSLGLFAAAAAVVGGVAITQVLPSLGSQSDSESTSAGAESYDERASEDAGAAKDSAAEDSDAADSAAPQELNERATASEEAAAYDVPTLTRSKLKPQLRAVKRGPETAPLSAVPTCPVRGAGSAPQIPITYDGLPGTLVLRAPVAGRQQAEIYLCGEDVAERTVQIPVE